MVVCLFVSGRGISEDDALKLIVEGFFSSITNELDIPGLNQSLWQQVMPRVV